MPVVSGTFRPPRSCNALEPDKGAMDQGLERPNARHQFLDKWEGVPLSRRTLMSMQVKSEFFCIS